MSAPSADTLPLQRLYHWERTRADAVWLTQPCGNEVIDYTWGEAASQARRMAAWLKQQDWPAGSRIAVLGKNSAHWIIADLAIWMAGHVAVPLFPANTAESARQILMHSRAVACFVGRLDDDWARFAPVLAQPNRPCIALPLAPAIDALQWDAIVASTAPLEGEPGRAAGELATLVYTSGTTGMAKGVMHSFGTLTAAVTMIATRIRYGEEDRMLSYLPLAHLAERVLVELGSLVGGMRIYFSDTLATFAADLRRARPTIFVSVPRLWSKFHEGVSAKIPPEQLERMLDMPGAGEKLREELLQGLGLAEVRFAISGTAPIPPELLRWYARLGLLITEGYGMSENAAASHSTLPGEFYPGTVGKPYPELDVRLDPDTSEVQMRGPSLMLGYFEDPELTRAAYTADGWFRTGDKGELDAHGNLKIVGRVKDNFKTSKGKYVAPAPIENQLMAHPALENCLVAGAHRHQPLALVILNETALGESRGPGGREALEQSLGAHLEQVNAGLDPHEKLQCLVICETPWSVEDGTLTPTMKIKRSRIEELLSPRFGHWVSQGRSVVWNT
ncbi:AMP-binding protein [Paraburkholderia pallida]|uniref:AMP-binding acetyl-CoA synthetase n=1 Tax=Paraburkholderia pallida TaxID=2547399 RepID=A0A4P7CYZ0_9BURK|nr:AMP-binding protein [Paraburkholderia pallida]QBQ99351.1 AMP-binding acetyl-CoA synthetase [Paraburkholderia pallida]